MSTRLFFIALIAVIGLSACSKKEETMDDGIIVSPARDGEMTGGPLQGDEMYTDGTMMDGVDSNPLAGTQQDLTTTVGDRVFFDTDRSDINAEARAVLTRQAEWLNRYTNTTITIEGHADERGTREYNLALGERRAQAAKNYLVNLGVDPRRLSTISYGKEQPAVMGANPSAWAQNRRAVTRVD